MELDSNGRMFITVKGDEFKDVEIESVTIKRILKFKLFGIEVTIKIPRTMKMKNIKSQWNKRTNRH